MGVSELAKGQNATLPSTSVQAVLAWSRLPAPIEVDATALLATSAGKVRGDHDLVFYNAPLHPDGAVRHLGKRSRVDGGSSDVIEVDLNALTPDVDRVAITAAIDGGVLGQVSDLTLELGTTTGHVLARCKLVGTVESAMVAVELYRRDGGWKIRHVSQGWATGLAGLATDFGIEVEEPRPAPGQSPQFGVGPQEPSGRLSPTEQSATSSVPGGVGGAPHTRITKGEDLLPPDMRKKLSMRKRQVALSLAKGGAAALTARVVLVLDASGSMAPLYSKGVVADVVERMAAVAAQLDDDGSMQAWTFASNPARLPDLHLSELPTWTKLHVRVGEMRLFRSKGKPKAGQVDMAQVGIQNEEQKVIREVRDFVRSNPSPDPTLVLFFSDGGVYRNAEIEKELRASTSEPIFWQFVGLGRAGFGVLERFDTLSGRLVDNTGFFKVMNISKERDEVLYDKLLSEFPSYVRDARAAGVLRS